MSSCGSCGYRATQISAAARAAVRLDARAVATAGGNIVRSAVGDLTSLTARVAAAARALADKGRSS